MADRTPGTTPRIRIPNQLAAISADRCTGCEACIEVCPVDCIAKIERPGAIGGLEAFCEIDWDRCIGCRLCVRIADPRADGYTLLVCPWDAIAMVAREELASVVDRLGGPPGYAAAHRGRLLEAAQRQSSSPRRNDRSSGGFHGAGA